MAKDSASGAKASRSTKSRSKPAASKKVAGSKAKASASKPKSASSGRAKVAVTPDAMALGASTSLKQQVDAELASLDALAKQQGQTTFCECAVATKENVGVTVMRIRRSACERFSILHAAEYNVALD